VSEPIVAPQTLDALGEAQSRELLQLRHDAEVTRLRAEALEQNRREAVAIERGNDTLQRIYAFAASFTTGIAVGTVLAQLLRAHRAEELKEASR